MINTLPIVPIARQPRGIVRINGTAAPGWLSWTVTSNNYYEADTFRVSFASSGMGEGSVQKFIEQREIFVEILAGFPTNPAAPNEAELQSLIYGRVDEIDFDPTSRVLTMTGRDLTAVFIDNRIDRDWKNTPASSIAKEIAQRHGLIAKVSPMFSSAGTTYKNDQQLLVSARTEWDLLTSLAREQGFACYVVGQELHFEPDPGPNADPYVIQWYPPTNYYGSPVSNVQSLNFIRAMTVSKGVSVTVRSTSRTKKAPVVSSYPSKAKSTQPGKSGPFGGVQQYYFTTTADQTPLQVQLEAQRRYNELIAHEMKMTARLPGDNLLSTKNVLVVQGTGTSFDQTYYPSEITRQMSINEGYTMTVHAKNHSPQVTQA